MKSNILFIIAGLLSLLSSAAIADSSFADSSFTDTEQQSLEKMIRARAEQQLAAEDKKYTQIFALAGDRQDELAKRKSEVTHTYKKWRDLKSAVEASPNKANSIDFNAVKVAAQAYSEANKAFIALQKDILINANVPIKDHVAYLVVTR